MISGHAGYAVRVRKEYFRDIVRPTIRKEVDAGDAYYTVFWSPLAKSDKYEINAKVPSLAGIIELYSMDAKGGLNLFQVSEAWYGGVRHNLRSMIDPELQTDPDRRKVLRSRTCYYRYALTDSHPDMMDVFYFFAVTHFPDRSVGEPSGRYGMIYVKEVTTDRITQI